jgi:hypothetical protein
VCEGNTCNLTCNSTGTCTCQASICNCTGTNCQR